MLIVGGSASSGSSLLARCLNRHSKMVCGPESSLFARPQLFLEWNRIKSRLVKKSVLKLKNYGWHRYYGVDINAEFYQLDPKELKVLTKQAKSYSNFLAVIDSHLATTYDVEHWVEKTPSNANCFDTILREIPMAKLVLTVRDPYDSIASLVRRGFSVFYATSLYLMNTSTGCVDDPRLISIKYEDLVNHPKDNLEFVCNHIEEDYEEGMLVSENEEVSMQGWKYDETGEIGQGSIGRFEELDDITKNDICHAANSLAINPMYKSIGSQPRYSRIEDICHHFGYQFRPPVTKKGRFRFKKDVLMEGLTRTFKGYPTGFGNFPIVIKR